MTSTSHTIPDRADSHSQSLSRRLDDLGWGLFLLMTGAMWLLPDAWLAPGVWAVGTGLLLLVLNAVRYVKGVGVHPLTVVLGVVALAGGLADIEGLHLPLIAFFLLVAGATLLVKPFFHDRG